MIRADIRSFFRQMPGLFRNDSTAVMLVIANVYPVIDMLWRGEPIGSILVIYWMQMMIIGFWNCIRLVVVARWWAVLIVPMFVLIYLSIVNIFGFIAGGLLDDQMRGTEWVENFSLWNYWLPAVFFFATHGLSFWEHFIGEREYEKIGWEDQVGKPFFRAMPMWVAALFGGFIGGFFNTAAVAALFILPVKIALDLIGHFVEHDALDFDDSVEKGVQS